MSQSDLRITEVLYDGGPNGFEFIEITNTSTDTAADLQGVSLTNSDFLPIASIELGPEGAVLAPGTSAILIPVGVPIDDFLNFYGPIPVNALILQVFPFGSPFSFGLESGNASLGLTGIDLIIDSVFVPDIADSTGPIPESVTLGEDENGPTATAGLPTPGFIGEPFTPPPPPPVDEIDGTNGNDVLAGTGANDIINGLNGNDEMTGGAGDDDLSGGKGADVINGGVGDDIIDGGRQSDILSGGAGEDEILGDAGNDEINGNGGNDDLFGGSGNDAMFGGAGDDVMNGDHGKDMMNGGDGNDELYGGASADTLAGGGGNDELYGGSSNDVLRGGEGNDLLDGGSQSDRLNGGDGDDVLIGGLGNDVLIGGAGADTFVFSGTVNRDRITDFEAGIDQIDLTGYGPISTEEAIAVASQVGDDVVLDLGANGRVTLENVDLGDLSLDDFIFIPDDIFIAT